MRPWRHVLLAALAIAGSGFAAAAYGEDQVRVTAGVHEGYGRIAFAWPEAVAFEAKLDGRTVTVHFAQPLKADLSALPRRLPNYVDEATQSGDQDVLIRLHRDL